MSEQAVLFDGITACTINYLEQVPWILNLILHLGMFVTYEIFVTLLFWYWVSVTVGIPKGKYTNYSMGISVHSWFATLPARNGYGICNTG